MSTHGFIVAVRERPFVEEVDNSAESCIDVSSDIGQVLITDPENGENDSTAVSFSSQ